MYAESHSGRDGAASLRDTAGCQGRSGSRFSPPRARAEVCVFIMMAPLIPAHLYLPPPPPQVVTRRNKIIQFRSPLKYTSAAGSFIQETRGDDAASCATAHRHSTPNRLYRLHRLTRAAKPIRQKRCADLLRVRRLPGRDGHANDAASHTSPTKRAIMVQCLTRAHRNDSPD